MRISAIAIVALMMNAEAVAQSSTSTMSGNLLLEHCQSRQGANVQQTVNSGSCFGFILGVMDSIALYQEVMKTPRNVCVPPASTKQLKDLVVQYLSANPAHRHEDAAGLVYLALLTAYPCK